MGEEAGIGKMNSNAGVGAKIVDIPLGTVRIGVVAKVGEEKDGLIVICPERTVVHCPDPVSGVVLSKLNVNILSYGWSWIWGDWKPWCGFRERILQRCQFGIRGIRRVGITLAH
jgi:hypothetical protein